MDMEDIIKDFFNCSLKNDFSDFDFDYAFEEYVPYLHRNNMEHGLCEFDEYLDNLEELEYLDQVDVSALVVETVWCHIGEAELVEGLAKTQWELLKRQFEQCGTHSELYDLEQRVENRGTNLSTPQLVTLFDECIHAEHCNGFILEDVDLDDLREEVEEERKEHVTNIRDFLVSH